MSSADAEAERAKVAREARSRRAAAIFMEAL
jgi:hypothetical protein